MNDDRRQRVRPICGSRQQVEPRVERVGHSLYSSHAAAISGGWLKY
jgi:hypothetical protein